jgi:hypothetical protein
MWKPLLAAAGGALVGFLFAKTRYEKAAYDYAVLRIEEAKVFAEERANRAIAEFQAEASAEALDAVAAVFEKDTEQMARIVEENSAVADLITNYAGFSSDSPSAPSNLDPEDDSESHIILIRRKEFFEGPVNEKYDQTAVTYYQNEDILIDAADKQLDVRAAIGSIRPNWFGQEADDENVCYVRNTKLEIEFEVNRSQGSYARDVLGLIPSEDEE